MENAEETTPMEGVQEGTEDVHDQSAEEEEGTVINTGVLHITVPPPPPPPMKADGTGPRLVITHIVNENFKSYAGKQILGPFHKSFSCIVGPNGSGKSNVIDAMLFVFGYRAQKIRSKKISVLIHNSDQHRNLTSCTVSVHFQKILDKPGDDFEVVPGTKFVVSRTANKDNTSAYYVDGRRMQFKEVAALLRGHGIDLDHNRFLILQGEVEQISMMKPKAQTEHDEGMLEYLEDIIGSSRFKEPIEQLDKAVEELNEQRGEKLNRVKAVEKEKDELEGSKNEAMAWLSAANGVTVRKHKLFQVYIHECTVNEKLAAAKVAEIEEGMSGTTEELKKLETEKRDKTKDNKKANKALDKLQKECADSKAQFSEFERQDVKLREDLKHAKGKDKKLKASLETEKKKLEDLRLVPGKSEKDVEELSKKIEQLEKKQKVEEEKVAEVMASLKTETQGLQKEKEEKEKVLMSLQKDLNETKSKMVVAQSELDIYLSRYDNAVTQLQGAQQNLDTAVNTLKDRKSGIKDIEKRIPECEKELQKASSDLEKVTKEEAEVVQELRSCRMKVEEARSSMQQQRSRGKVQEALMLQKQSGKIPGIFGRLGDLGAIDDKYDVAISTACGALDLILVDTMDTAQRCVNFLKKNDIGRASFLGLDQQQKFRENCKNKINTPENIPRLFDLVKVKDERILPAFYYALRDTLVADNLDQATRCAFQGGRRHRVVTLGGQLIDQSGTMTGGGTKVIKGRMGSCVASDFNPKEVENMENKLARLSQESQQLKERKRGLEEAVQRLERELTKIKMDQKKFDMDIKALTEQEVTLKQQVTELQQQVKEAEPDKTQQAKLEKNLAAHKKEYEKAAEASSKVEAEVQSLHKKIMDISNSKMKSAQDKLDNVNKEIDEANAAVTKAKVANKTAKRNITKTEDKIGKLEKDIEENKTAVGQFEVELTTLEEKATEVLNLFQETKEKMQEVEAVVADIQKELDILEAKENELKSASVDIRHQLEEKVTAVKENQGKIKYWKKEIEKLTINVVDDEDAPCELKELTEEEIKAIDKQALTFEITVQEEKQAEFKPNMAAINEYRKKEQLYLKRVSELDEITSRRDQQRKAYEDLRKQRLDEFMAGFGVITNKLKEMYQMITLGGDAELELVDSLDPFSEGIVFSVRPPKKSWKNISNLSGGEKTLSSLALVFALHHYKPTPLYVMDEIDAALDFKNVSIVASYIKERTKNAQFIIISLRNNMFELADRLVGIYKTNNSTKSVAVDPAVISERAAQVA
ncbi:structural maintenance of chromosomes protein 4-like [Branchiostoma lanceolatum]|uniref:structural maintenance of chromosomes protein 4-like n=1 Tax=Branchiostoma lanceolatum TaxID=7740 RepID=UPI0034516014